MSSGIPTGGSTNSLFFRARLFPRPVVEEATVGKGILAGANLATAVLFLLSSSTPHALLSLLVLLVVTAQLLRAPTDVLSEGSSVLRRRRCCSCSCCCFSARCRRRCSMSAGSSMSCRRRRGQSRKDFAETSAGVMPTTAERVRSRKRHWSACVSYEGHGRAFHGKKTVSRPTRRRLLENEDEKVRSGSVNRHIPRM
ncbi:hypothetical protein TCDM_06880 [Trypanosoma cruzi Dm28c]|uniref:Uncharacterized protein n=1 Tax=Trypanosoma cruzi Dm28c TaxID=1416333 RepID=V5BK45_TRYCR|nr:hypothetical protein TCDM_06880 [Trypanosoma cruzi Dm28c]